MYYVNIDHMFLACFMFMHCIFREPWNYSDLKSRQISPHSLQAALAKKLSSGHVKSPTYNYSIPTLAPHLHF